MIEQTELPFEQSEIRHVCEIVRIVHNTGGAVLTVMCEGEVINYPATPEFMESQKPYVNGYLLINSDGTSPTFSNDNPNQNYGRGMTPYILHCD